MTKKILYIDMDNTLVDFTARLEGIAPSILAKYKGNEDEIPGVFAIMPPKPGAVDAFRKLSEVYDTYILSTAPWQNPSAWQHKIEWVHLHFGIDKGTPAWKRLILTHHKDLNRGDFLIDDRPLHNGADKFQGDVIAFGSEAFPDWAAVTGYLLGVTEPTSLAGLTFSERAQQVDRAQAIAAAAHTGQVDKLGVDYLQHPAAVSAPFDPVDQTLEHCAAWLHDVIEDTKVDADRLRLAGIHPEVIEVVELLTRRDGDGDEYYERIAANPAARAVKLADIAHNTDAERVAQLAPEDRERLRRKYAHALDVLGVEWADVERIRDGARAGQATRDGA